MKRAITILVILAVAAVAGYFGWREWQARQAASLTSNLQTVAAARGDLTSTIGATGIVRSKQSSFLFWKTSGTVEAVNAKVGDQVKAGDVLATLQQTSLPQNVIMAQADFVNAQKALTDLDKNADIAKVEAMKLIATYAEAVKNAQYQLDNFTVPTNQINMTAMEAVDVFRKKLDEARAAFEKYKFYPLVDTKRKELKEALDTAQSDYNAAVKRLEYEYQLDIAKSNLDKAMQDYEKWSKGPNPSDITAVQARIAAAQATLDQVSIKAPFDGAITLVDPQPGDQVGPNTQSFRLDDLTSMLVDLQVSEIDINQIKIGQDATLSFDAIVGKTYHGKVVEVARVGLSSQGVVDFNVTIEITDADEDVKSGMTAAVNIVVEQLNNVLLVPNRAVRSKAGQREVYILHDNQLVPLSITLGASSDTMSEVLAGDLKEGDAIVLNPPLVFDQSGPPPFVGGGSR